MLKDLEWDDVAEGRDPLEVSDDARCVLFCVYHVTAVGVVCSVDVKESWRRGMIKICLYTPLFAVGAVLFSLRRQVLVR